jgi:serine/threonine protein kinase
VKIGDFGLATASSPLTSLTGTAIDVVDGGFHGTVSEKSSEVVSSSGQLTGQIGTALYVAPELKTIVGCKFFFFHSLALFQKSTLTLHFPRSGGKSGVQ